MHSFTVLSVFLGLASAAVIPVDSTIVPREKGHHDKFNVQVGVRPYYLVGDMDESPLKEKLASCSEDDFKSTDFVFSHRGAPLEFPEHTLQGYSAAHRMGAGVIECDVTFTKDKQLVCRHSQCDLHFTTNILATPLASKCSKPFTPSHGTAPADALCCTSDITLAEFQTLCGKMEGVNPNATNIAEYMDGTPYFRTDLYAQGCPKVMSVDSYIPLIDSWGLKFTAELKQPEVTMPFDGYTQEQYAQDLVNKFNAHGIKPNRVFLQSFLETDIFFWIDHAPAFAKQAVYLDERVDTLEGYANATATMSLLAKRGVKIIAPPFFALTKINDQSRIVPSEYAVAARRAGLAIVAWSFDRSGWLQIDGGGYYYGYVKSVMKHDGDMYEVLDVLARQVKIKAMFTDWAGTVTYYANCMGL